MNEENKQNNSAGKIDISSIVGTKVRCSVHYWVMMIVCGMLSLITHAVHQSKMSTGDRNGLSFVYYMKSDLFVVFLAMLCSFILFLIVSKRPLYNLLYLPSLLVIAVYAIHLFITATKSVRYNFNLALTISLYGILPLGAAVLILSSMYGKDVNR